MPLGEFAAAAALARDTPLTVGMGVAARRQIALTVQDFEETPERFEGRVVTLAAGDAVLRVEFEIGALRARPDVVDVERSSARRPDEAGEDAGVAVAFDDALAKVEPLGRGVERIAHGNSHAHKYAEYLRTETSLFAKDLLGRR